MTESIGDMLRALRDIEGVYGSFLIGERSAVLGRDVPAACTTEVLQTVGARLQQLCDAFVSAEIGAALETTTLNFAQHKLQIRALGSALLVAVVTADVNLPALRMAMNMLGRQLSSALAPAERASEVHTRASRPPSELQGRSYRGRPVPR